MTTEAEARIACPTPTKHRYATLETADKDALRLAVGRGRKLVAYDTCVCGWVHLSTERPSVGIGSTPMTADEIIMLGPDDFNQLVRNEVRGLVHPDTAKALRDTSLTRTWITALKLFQGDLNMQKQHKGGDRSPAVVEWRRRIDRVVQSARERTAEARSIQDLKIQRNRIEQGTLANALRTDDEIEGRLLRQMAGDIAAEKLKRAHLEEYMLLVAAEFERFNIPPSKAMQRILEQTKEDT